MSDGKVSVLGGVKLKSFERVERDGAWEKAGAQLGRAIGEATRGFSIEMDVYYEDEEGTGPEIDWHSRGLKRTTGYGADYMALAKAGARFSAAAGAAHLAVKEASFRNAFLRMFNGFGPLPRDRRGMIAPTGFFSFRFPYLSQAIAAALKDPR